MLLVGKCLGTESRIKGSPGNTFEETTIHVLEGVRSHAVTTSADFPKSDLPRDDENVALSVYPRAFPLRSGGIGQSITATERDREVERRLFGPAVVSASASAPAKTGS